jgi:hypothetical protein
MKIAHVLAAVLVTVAATLWFVRRNETTVTIAGEAVRFPYLNDMQWDPANRTLTRTGSDPYGWVEVPAAGIPLRRVTFELGGTYSEAEGFFYVFQSPDYLPELVPALVETKVTHGPGTLTVSAELDRSKVLRLDLPDFLPRTLELRRIVIQTAEAGSGSPAFIAMVLALGGAAICLVWPWLAAALPRRPWLAGVAVLALIAGKQWLAADLGVTVYGNAAHDDALYVQQAHSIMEGHWLGTYNELTLAKGPAYPLFLAGVGRLGCPLRQAQTLLHALACLVFVVALRPLVPNAGLRLLLFAVLLFDPQTLSAGTVGRVLRVGIQPALVLLTLGGFIGLAARIHRPLRHLVGWALGAGLAGAAFWFSREEGIWLVPSIVVLVVVAAGLALRGSDGRKWWRLAVLAVPFVLGLLASGALAYANARRYGAPVTVDFTNGAYPQAFGALARITPAEAIPRVPITKETRLRAYAVSPAFAELRPYLEGEYGAGWARYGWEGSDHPAAGKEIRGGWIPWALRGAAQAAGHYENARTAEAYWRQVATEINAACADGRLAAGAPRSGFMPRWQLSLLAPLQVALRQAAEVALRLGDFQAGSNLSSATEEQMQLFASVIHQPGVVAHRPPSVRAQARVVLYQLYRWCGWGAALVAGVSALVVAAVALRRRRFAVELAVLTALCGGVVALLLVVALVDVTSFGSLYSVYLAPATALALATWVLAPAWAWRLIREPWPAG